LSGRVNYYVYYKLPAPGVDEARQAVERMFDRIERDLGVRGRWLRRRDDPATYMEVFEGVADTARFEALLEREGLALGVERRVERFIDA
jgi:hypothetical protein